MAMPVSRAFPLLVTASAFAWLVTAGCGSDTGSGGTGAADGGDGRYHPGTENGTHVSEDAACSALAKAQEMTLQGAGCPATTRPCPDLLRAQFTTKCMEYDQGSVQGCVDYYGQQSGCDAIKKAIDDCAVTPFTGTDPKGCPSGS